MEEIIVRKIQVTGGSTLTVSLPKEWAKNVGLKAGSYVSIMAQPDDTLLIIPGKALKRKALKRAELNVKGSSPPNLAVRQLIALYLAGYDLIEVFLDGENIKTKDMVKEVTKNKLIGMEVIDETASTLTFQCLVTHRELPIDKALSRMNLLAFSMCNDAVESLTKLNKELASEIVARDDEVDRLYFFVVRLLKGASTDRTILGDIGLSSPRECLGYRMVAKSIERVADHATRIAKAALNINNPVDHELSKLIFNLKDTALTMLKNSIKLLLNKFNIEKANNLIQDLGEVEILENEILRTMLNKPLKVADLIELRMAIESLRRIAEYSSDIAEIAINLSTK